MSTSTNSPVPDFGRSVRGSSFGGREECKVRGHAGLVAVGQVPIDLPDENTAVAMPEPRRDGHKINPRHHALACKEVSEVVEPHAGQAGRAPNGAERVLQLVGGHVAGAAPRAREQVGGVRLPAA